MSASEAGRRLVAVDSKAEHRKFRDAERRCIEEAAGDANEIMTNDDGDEDIFRMLLSGVSEVVITSLEALLRRAVWAGELAVATPVSWSQAALSRLEVKVSEVQAKRCRLIMQRIRPGGTQRGGEGTSLRRGREEWYATLGAHNAAAGLPRPEPYP